MIILSVDLGDVRTGLAVCDPGELLAYPAGTIRETDRGKLLEKVAAAAEERRAEHVIVGYPLNRDGSVGERAMLSERFAARLRARLGTVPVELWDERGTTIAADAALNLGTTRGKKKRKVIDTVAATILLESYLSWRKAAGG